MYDLTLRLVSYPNIVTLEKCIILLLLSSLSSYVSEKITDLEKRLEARKVKEPGMCYCVRRGAPD